MLSMLTMLEERRNDSFVSIIRTNGRCFIIDIYYITAAQGTNIMIKRQKRVRELLMMFYQ